VGSPHMTGDFEEESWWAIDCTGTWQPNSDVCAYQCTQLYSAIHSTEQFCQSSTSSSTLSPQLRHCLWQVVQLRR